jgi:endosialidase-like protein
MGKKSKGFFDDPAAEGGSAGVAPMDAGPAPTPAGAKMGVGPTGYDYSGWGSTHQLGSRPAAKTDWDAMTPEQRAAIGLPDWNSYKTAAKAWRANFQPGGGNFEFQTSLARDIANSGAQSWDQISQILANRGIINQKEQGQALYRRLQGAYQGQMDPTGRYHLDPSSGQWVDVATSDLAKRGIAGRADYHGAAPTGLQAVMSGLGMTGGKSDIMQFQDFLHSGQSSIEGVDPQTGLLYNTDPSGRKTYYDQGGYQIDPATGQTTGHYIGGFQGGGGQRSGAPTGAPQPTVSGYAGGSFGGGGGSFAQGGPAPGGGGDIASILKQYLGGGGGGQGLAGAATGGAHAASGGPPGPPQQQPTGQPPGDAGGTPGDGMHTIYELPPSQQPGATAPFTPGDYPTPGPWSPQGGPVYDVGAWQNPQLQSILMGQAGGDLAGQQFQLGRAQQEYAGAQPLERFLQDLYGGVLGVGFNRGGGGPAYGQLGGPAVDAADRSTWGLLAPEMNRIAGDTDAALERLKQESPVGGERSAAQADILRSGQAGMLGARQALQNQALGGITDMMNSKKGFNPAGNSGAGLGMLGDLTSRRGQDVGMRGQDLDYNMGMSNQELQYLLGQMGDQTSRRGQDFDYSLGQSGQSLQERLAREQMRHDAQQASKNRSSSFWGGLLSTIGGIGGALLSDRNAKRPSSGGTSFNPYTTPLGGYGTLSDRETKEQIDGYSRSLKDLKKLQTYSFQYKEDAPEMAGERHVGVMAQDLQKIAPEAVEREADGFLRIKPMALVAMTMNSVKDLDKRIAKLTDLVKKGGK